MRKIFGLTAGLLLICGLVSAQGTIVGSDHDFSDQTWSLGEICLPCHTPHNAYNFQPAPDGSNELVPLWNHTQTTATFTVYSSPSGTLDAAGTLTQPAGVSRACLSCHDGTVALDAFGGATGGTTIGGGANLGSDLSNDHPVSFTYNSALATTDGELHNPATTQSGLGSTIQNDMLFNDQMECGSCHDVHNTPGLPTFLIKTNDGSALCLTCHDK